MQNPYRLDFPARLGLSLSVLEFQLDEALDTPYRLSVAVTAADPDLPLASLIDQTVTFTIQPPSFGPNLAIPGLGSLNPPPPSRSWHGVVRKASRGRSHREETLYRFDIAPRIARLADHRATRLFQNQTIPAVIEAVLRRHQLTGSDFQFALTDDHPAHDHLTQYRETDLQFIQRLAAQAGIFYQFRQSKDGQDVLCFGNNLEHYARGQLKNLPLRDQAGLESAGEEAVSRLEVAHQPMLKQVRRRDFNYRSAGSPQDHSAGFGGDTPAAQGVDYDWGEGQRDAIQGERIVQLRHQLSVSRQCQAHGEGNALATRPGEVLRLDHTFAEAPHGWLITAAHHSGRRDQAYSNHFSAIPADRVWRPALCDKPLINGTLPAMVVSPGDNSYRYPFLDEEGRYRVRYLFDLDSWSPGGDSRPVRLAKPFAGGRFGFHLPLHAGTRVNLAFTGGDPERPYIASVMHDSVNRDHINTQWHSRNVLLTKAHNKLRLEDLQGKEHIKLATEYGKTQLNLGHLVNAGREQRGEGFELRTDHWGALRAGKGLFLSAEAASPAASPQLDMDQARRQLEEANRLAQTLANAAATAHALPPDVQAQVDLLQHSLKQLARAGILISAPAGIGVATTSSIQHAAGAAYAVTAGQQLSLSTLDNLAANANGAVSLFARTGGMKLYANGGSVDLQAQGGPLQLLSAKEMHLGSNRTLTLHAHDSIELAAGGFGLRISAKGLEVFGDLTLNGTMHNGGKAGLAGESATFPQTELDIGRGLSL
ncbi:type VI secretion system Vgr family protein [uncultured Aquitalea sp.]|uniref:type VI secretion system Vgr family protein n=1 Tax=uncultured Aquitalea sp. TaxID=540272 RepID=UPI0025CF498A|nr:type VI secretion system Vgr family protein [uncultured Aquitalea sp.]